MDLNQEFDRQLQNLLDKKYPFISQIEPLRGKLKEIDAKKDEEGYLPFVLVVKSEMIPTEKAMDLVERQGKSGYVNMDPVRPEDFKTIESVVVPEAKAYLLTDIDRGQGTLNIRPADAMEIIKKQHRSPLTIDEGVAIVTHFPDFLQKNNCFSLLGSRINGKQYVPALWITGEKKVRLGWCWERNPHTWLGSASCGERLG